MNAVQIEGRVVFPPRSNQTGSGKVVTNFVLDVPTGRGERKTGIKCVGWEDAVGGLQFAQGDYVRVAGRLESRSYEKDGRKVEVTEVIAESVEKVAHKSAAPAKTPASDDEIPF